MSPVQFLDVESTLWSHIHVGFSWESNRSYVNYTCMLALYYTVCMYARKKDQFYLCMYAHKYGYIVVLCMCLCVSMYVPASAALFLRTHRGPSIYDVHTEGAGWSGSGGREGRGSRPDPCGSPQRKLKLESTDVILSSSHAKKWVSFLPEFHLWTE